jgi:hypothetical protein
MQAGSPNTRKVTLKRMMINPVDAREEIGSLRLAHNFTGGT